MDFIIDNFINLLSKNIFRTSASNVSILELSEAYYQYKNIVPKSNIINYYVRGLIYHPDILKDFLNTYMIIPMDLCSMVSRCIEHSLEEKYSQVLKDSVKSLIEYIKIHKLEVNLLLLVNKYNINWNMYEYCKNNGIVDKHLESKTKLNILEYNEILSAIDYEDLYGTHFGYRNIYHGLMYAPKNISEKEIDRWIECINVCCSYQAFLDYFNLSNKLTSKDEIKKYLSM